MFQGRRSASMAGYGLGYSREAVRSPSARTLTALAARVATVRIGSSWTNFVGRPDFPERRGTAVNCNPNCNRGLSAWGVPWLVLAVLTLQQLGQLLAGRRQV